MTLQIYLRSCSTGSSGIFTSTSCAAIDTPAVSSLQRRMRRPVCGFVPTSTVKLWCPQTLRGCFRKHLRGHQRRLCARGLGAGTSNGAKKLDRLSLSELLADMARYKATAANLSLRFEAAQRYEQVTPRRRHTFAAGDVSREHTPAQREGARKTPHS